MRVCHVVEAGGGVAQVVIDLVRAGVAAGEDITVIYSPSRATPDFIQTLTSLLGPKVVSTPMRREVGLHDVPDLWGLYWCLRRMGPFEVIHGHSSKAGALVRLVGILFPHSIKIYSPHAFVTLDPKASFLFGIVEKILGCFGDSIFVLSQVEKYHALEKLRMNKNKIEIIHNGIEIDYPADRSTARRTMGYGPDEFVVGFVGRFVPQKNPLRLIEAFTLAVQSNPALRLALIGDGPLRAEVDAAIASQNVTDKVRVFSGYVGRDLMPGLDCLLCASDYEGFALVFLEALAAGVPIVSTPVGGAHEAVIEGETGFMTSDFSPVSLAHAVTKLAQIDPVKRTQMSQSARRHVQNFSLEHIAKQMQSLYASLLAKRRH